MDEVSYRRGIERLLGERRMLHAETGSHGFTADARRRGVRVGILREDIFASCIAVALGTGLSPAARCPSVAVASFRAASAPAYLPC